MSSEKDITAVIPFHNYLANGTYLNSLLNSVTNTRFMMIVVCDSIKKSEFDELVGKYLIRPEIKFVHVDFQSAAKTRNKGLAEATSPWVVFWDCDDKVDENKYLKVLDDHREQDLDLIVGQIESFDSNSASIVSTSSTNSIESLATYPAFTRIIYKRLFIGTLRFPAVPLCEDQCFLGLLISKNPQYAFTNEILYSYRVNNPLQGSSTLFNVGSHIKAINFICDLQSNTINQDGIKALKILTFRLITSTLKRLRPESSKYISTLIRYFVQIFCTNLWLYKFSRPIIVKRKFKQQLPRLILVGGLGNQLFQYSFMVSQFGNENFKVNGNLGIPRISKSGYPDIFSFNIPEEIVSSKNFLWIKSKVITQLLRLSSYGKRDLASKILFLGISILNIVFALFNRGQGLVFLADGVGFFEKNQHQSRKHKYYIGCFHSYVWPAKIGGDRLKSLFSLKTESPWLISFREQFKNHGFGVVHIRRGDYLETSNLGYLPLGYFEEQMIDALNQGIVQRFLVFSDDPEFIESNLRTNLLEKAVIVGQNQEDAATNLIAFNVGDFFVLSNSTFSWWGAYLSYDRVLEVVVPKYWYADKRSPRLIYPDFWKERDPKL